MLVKLIDLSWIIKLIALYQQEPSLKKMILVMTIFLKPSFNGSLILILFFMQVVLNSMKNQIHSVTILDLKPLRYMRSFNIFIIQIVKNQLTTNNLSCCFAIFNNYRAQIKINCFLAQK